MKINQYIDTLFCDRNFLLYEFSEYGFPLSMKVYIILYLFIIIKYFVFKSRFILYDLRSAIFSDIKKLISL
jgi:hypothetical protein